MNDIQVMSLTNGSISLYTVNLGTGVKARCKTGSQSADDDAGPNCCFYKMYSSQRGGLVYKTTTPFSESDDAGSQRAIYFFSDIPHYWRLQGTVCHILVVTR